jgi:hypothetical protein
MTLQPGFRFVRAPHFHLAVDWPQRLLVGGGLEEVDGRFFPQGPWRQPTEPELSLLTGRPGEAALDKLEACACLFQLPGHLRSLWWNLFDEAAGAEGAGATGYKAPMALDVFANQVSDFLSFKGQAFPERARCDVVVSQAGQRSVRWDSTANRPAGLHCSLAPWCPWPQPEGMRPPGLWGVINLGDEDTSLVFLNLSIPQLAPLSCPREPNSSTAAAIAERFLRSSMNYPPIRLALGASEGCRFPAGGLIVDGYTEGKQEPDVLLVISHGPWQQP